MVFKLRNESSSYMKKVLLISSKIMHYRVSNYNYFARRFSEIGWQFIIRSNGVDNDNPHPLQFDFKKIPFKFWLYKKEISKINPDIVILYIELKSFIVWPLVHWLKLKRIPVIYWNKGINLEVHNPYLRNQFFYYMHNICDGIILFSKDGMKQIKEKNHHKTSIANNTINFEDYPEVTKSKAEIKNKYGIPFEKVVLFVARMRDVKRVDHLIKIFHKIDNDNYGLVIVGDEMDNNINNIINKKNTKYLGKIYDPEEKKISELFKMADIFCIPGEVGLACNQAFYWELPVITEAVPFQPPEICYLKNGVNGYIVPVNDLNELKNKILFLLENDKIRMEFSKNARKEILKNGSVANMFMGFKDCIDYLTEVEK